MKPGLPILFLSLLALPSPLRAAPDLAPLRAIAVQDSGRVKPLDTFARELSRRVTGARAFGAQSVMGKDPVEWVLAMMSSPEEWRRQPMLRVTHVGLRQAAGLPAGDHFSFEDLTTHPGLQKAIGALRARQQQDPEAKLDPIEREISTLDDTLQILGGVFSGDSVRLLPHPTDAHATWFSVADLQQIDAPPVLRVRTLVAALTSAYAAHDEAGVTSAAAALNRRLAEIAPANYPAARDLEREVHYNSLKPFRVAWLLYLAAFLTLLASFPLAARGVRVAGFALLLSAFCVHAYGMVVRMMISGRPPVTNMYESVIWVAWGAVLFALVFEAIYKTRVFAACASGMAVLSLVLADNVPILDGAIDPLVPVLRDNMWLTIHVLTITLSYAAFFLGMAIAHVNLALYFFAPNRRPLLAQMSTFLYRCLQLGVLLGAAGTMLGGWWASYSWGRFWGWDAKETSIFVALMFYLAILHGRMVGVLRDFGTAVAGVLGFLGVLWAWYGVNFVLGVGLHSYGFGSGGYAYVGGFVAFEVAVVVASWLRYRSLAQKKRAAAAAPAPTLQPAS